MFKRFTYLKTEYFALLREYFANNVNIKKERTHHFKDQNFMFDESIQICKNYIWNRFYLLAFRNLRYENKIGFAVCFNNT